MEITRRMMLVAAPAILAAFGTFHAAAAAYPQKPVTLVVPYKAGGTTETIARVFSRALGAELGANVVVKTRPGAGGAVGSAEVAASDPDGHTVLLVASTSLIWPPLTQKVEYDLDSFTYVSQIAEWQQAIVAKSDAPFDTWEELLEHARTNSLNYADQSLMSRSYINYIGKQEGVTWTGIPTKGGGEMVPFLLGGKVDFAWSGGIHNRYPEKMKVLLSMNAGRLVAAPDTPSIGELYGVSIPDQAVIVVPAGTPADIVARLQSAIEVAANDPEVVDLITNKLKAPVKILGSEALTADIANTVEGLKDVIAKTQ